MKFKRLTVLLTIFTMIASQTAFAARLGGGKSYGMQRSYSSQQPRNTFTTPPAAPANNYNQQQPRSGMGAGTAAALGAAAGAAGGYMLGKSMSNNNMPQNASAAQVAEPQTSSNIPWGTIGILAVLLFLGLMLFRKNKANPGFSANANLSSNSENFNMSNMNRNNASGTQPSVFGFAKTKANTVEETVNDKMPDGVETIYFLRQVKGMFLHLQSMNNADNIAEISKYMTPGLYDEIKDTVDNNKFVADFTTVDCQLLNCETKDKQILASVKFYGLVSEEPNESPKPFSEIWNFVKPELDNSRWLICGITQEALA